MEIDKCIVCAVCRITVDSYINDYDSDTDFQLSTGSIHAIPCGCLMLSFVFFLSAIIFICFFPALLFRWNGFYVWNVPSLWVDLLMLGLFIRLLPFFICMRFLMYMYAACVCALLQANITIMIVIIWFNCYKKTSTSFNSNEHNISH